MSKMIGNVGMLDLTQATEESVKSIERIGNVGIVIYRAETAHLLTMLKNAGNIGKTLEIPAGHRYYNGTLRLNEEYFKQLDHPDRVFVNGTVIIDKEVSFEAFQSGKLHLVVNGEVYTPQHLAGVVTSALLKVGGASAEIYAYQYEPRFESGKLKLNNAYLASITDPISLVMSGVLELDKDLDMERFAAGIDSLRMNGKAVIHESQSPYFYDKAKAINGSLEVIPTGFEYVTKPLRLNARTIRRFNGHKFYTKQPIIMEADVTRDAFSRAISEIQSTSFIICSEDIEDLIWERCPNLNTEILSYEQSFIFVSGEETWSKDQLLALEQPVTFIVDGTFILDDDVTEDDIKHSISSLDLFGDVVVGEKRIKGILYPYLRVNNGSIIVKGTEEELAGIGNVGMLSL
ncbi:hypothetical protein PVOR_08010 [Paenibacillus vortex V453]|uniref:Uncharacterized protein n=2 Tax=Paenibacillus TaxID=44249 RepID=A0A163KFI6_9BACL|nr:MULTISPECIES: hypothetical protein [Paenibacillus]EFU42218.1 hypothetical protein PVOR_08010 [Paenibacillus vortex V453]KZS47188.1 hypothetical protein AWU65_15265 [Paenibacillus glucanolyticus]MDH6672623.1 hypothetical protein [Paenibacillus sp. LBL]